MNDLAAAQFWFGFATGICTVVIVTLAATILVGSISEVAADFRHPEINEHIANDMIDENGEARFV